MRTQLFIENKEVELNDKVQFLLNKQFEDISNPTIIINDWSKTISIPFTEHNNRLFGYIYKPERIIIGTTSPSSYKNMNMYFDPTKKLDFKLIYNTTLVMEGYAKMNSIKVTDSESSYEITLYGTLGKLFYEMKKITFDTTTDDNTYLINGSDYVNTTMNKELIYNSWTSSGQNSSVLKKTTDSGYSITDIIGFAPNNAFSSDFDYKTYQYNDHASSTFENVLNNEGFESATGIKASAVIPNGLLPREIGEYRSYHQLPFIYWNKLFQIFQAKAESLTGYTFELDNEWFNTSNPYWYKLVYMLKSKDLNMGVTYANTYNSLNSGNHIGYWPWDINSTAGPPDWSVPYTSDAYVDGTISEQEPVITQASGRYKLFEFGNYNTFTFNINIDLFCIANHTDQTLSTTNTLICDIVAVGQNGHTETKTFTFNRSDVTLDGIYMNLPTISTYFTCTRADYGQYVKFQFTTKWLRSNTYPYQNVDYTPTSGGDVRIMGKNSSIKLIINNNDWPRSGSPLLLNDLWNNEYNLFNEIINYCKMYRICIFTDDFNKKIKFIPFKKYFTNYSIVDWTDKIDMSKDFIVKPITLENKYILFNYNNSNSKLSKEYKEQYSFNFGEYRLTTDYNFNDKTINLFDNNTKPSIVNTDNVLTWPNLRDYKRIVYSFPSEIFVYNKDKDRKEVEVFGQYYFHNGIVNFSTESSLHMPGVIITDDTPFQNANSTYFYNQMGGSDVKSVTTYPKLDIVYGNNLCLFNIPKTNYTYTNNYSGKNTIYSRYWDKYINERYNIQNKLVTCFVNFTSEDWTEFEFNHFIKINNMLYIVNKIYDYDIEGGKTTKVDLITISDINAYKS